MLSASKSGSASGASGYNLTRSLRFRASASGYLSRTVGTPTNNKIFTVSFWVKRGSLGSRQGLIGACNSAASNYWMVQFDTTVGEDTLTVYDAYAPSTYNLTTTQIFRDPSAWYHIVVAVDTTQATASNRTKIYVNGTQVTSFSASNYPSQNANTYFNTAGTVASIGSWNPYTVPYYYDGYLTEINFIDGQALTPSSFGSTNALTGVWQPARYTGTYGTNGFYLPFTDNSALTTSSNVGLGKDFSGNGNYWVTNNISITAGVTYDSMTDVPTLTSATAANFAVLNPLDYSSSGTITIANGNLQTSGSGAAYGFYRATMQMAVKTYWEQINTMANAGDGIYAGVGLPTGTISGSICYYTGSGQIYLNGSLNTTVASYTTGDVIGMAYDPATGNITFYKNNTSQATIATGYSSNAFPIVGDGSSNSETCNVNFGQQPFTYTPPTGFVALNTFNLPTSTIVKGNTVMDATLWTGNGTSQTITNAAGFKPDLIWNKMRSGAYYNILTDSVRGTNSQLFSNDTLAQETRTDRITAINSNGFSVGSYADVNANTQTFVGWQWQAGQGSTSSNTNGTITSTVSVNASAGFSIVTYTGNGTNGATVGHGLGVKPSLIIEKGRASTYNWPVQGCGVLWPTATQTLFLNNTSGLNSGSGVAAPTSSVFTPAATAYANESGLGYVAYCWTPIAGFSAFGSYTGNGSADGTFVYTGMRPRYILLKRTDSAIAWIVYDTARNTYNVTNSVLQPNVSTAEVTGVDIDVLSNGFKLRTTDAAGNASGGTYIYMAFAENPFRNALAR